MKYADKIDQLPLNDSGSKLTLQEQEILSSVFRRSSGTEIPPSSYGAFKISIAAGILFLVLMIPEINRLISRIGVDNAYIVIAIKCLIFMLIIFGLCKIYI